MREPSSITLKSDTRRTDKRKTKGPKAGQGTLVTKLKLTRRFLISVTAAGRTECYQQAILIFFLVQKLTVTGTPPNYVLFYGIESDESDVTENDYCRSKRFAQLLGQRIVMTLILAGEIIFVTSKLNQYYCGIM